MSETAGKPDITRDKQPIFEMSVLIESRNSTEFGPSRPERQILSTSLRTAPVSKCQLNFVGFVTFTEGTYFSRIFYIAWQEFTDVEWCWWFFVGLWASICKDFSHITYFNYICLWLVFTFHLKSSFGLFALRPSSFGLFGVHLQTPAPEKYGFSKKLSQSASISRFLQFPDDCFRSLLKGHF